MAKIVLLVNFGSKSVLEVWSKLESGHILGNGGLEDIDLSYGNIL